MSAVLEKDLMTILEPEWRETDPAKVKPEYKGQNVLQRCQTFRKRLDQLYIGARAEADPIEHIKKLIKTNLSKQESDEGKASMCMTLMLRAWTGSSPVAKAMLDKREAKFAAEVSVVPVMDDPALLS